MKMLDNGRHAAVATALMCLVCAAFAQAERAADFPQKAVTMVMPGPAGGGPDLVARALGEMLSGRWGQPVIVDNKPGATGMIGAESAARGESTGHRLLFAYAALVQAPAVFPKVPYVTVYTPDLLPGVGTNVTIVFGSEDKVAPEVKHAAVLRDALPGARYVRLEGVGHMPKLEAPAAFNRLVDVSIASA